MSKKIIILFVLIGIIVLPIAFRRSSGSALNGQDTLVVISAHPESNQAEFKRAFADWYLIKTGRTVKIDWRYPGGLSDILRLVDSLFDNAFRVYWEEVLKKPWTRDIEYSYGALQSDQLSSVGKEAYEFFRQSNIGCGIDVFFGAGGQELDLQKQKGRFVVPEVVQRYPEWFKDDVYPLKEGGFFLRDADFKWFGVVFSSYGIAYNTDILKALGIPPPVAWADLADPLYLGEIALADPTKSGSVKQSMEMIVQSCMHCVLEKALKDGKSMDEAEKDAVEKGWIDGLKLLQKLSANTRYFTEKSNRPVMSVASGNCAAAVALDFAAFAQAENLKIRGGQAPFSFVPPSEGTAFTPDGIALFRGAPNPKTAEAFMEFVLSSEGQALWALNAGAPNGPSEYTLHRFPIRKDFYQNRLFDPYRSHPHRNPYMEMALFPYEVSWTGPLLSVFHKIIRAIFIDPQEELRQAWAAIQNARKRSQIERAQKAEAIMADFSKLSYTFLVNDFKKIISSKDPMVEIAALSELTESFMHQYRQAIQMASGFDF